MGLFLAFVRLWARCLRESSANSLRGLQRQKLSASTLRIGWVQLSMKHSQPLHSLRMLM